MIANASKTLTTAMIPSSKLVVPSTPDMSLSSEWGLLACARIARLRLLAAVAHRFVQELPPLVRDAGRLVDRRSEAVELAREVVERRLELPTEPPSAIGEEQIPGHASYHGADNRHRHRPRVFHHDASSLAEAALRRSVSTSYVPRGAWTASAIARGCGAASGKPRRVSRRSERFFDWMR